MTPRPPVLVDVLARPRHLRPLDGIRGLAILMVMGSHVFASNMEGSGRVVRWAGEALHAGRFGVDLFFVLSGFLITGILVDSLDDPRFFRKFYARRALRIFPLYYGVLLALFLLTPLLGLQWHGMGWLMVGYLQNLRPQAMDNFSPGAHLTLNHFWSLAVEEQFYLIWPGFVFLIKDRRRLLRVTVWVAVGALALRLALIGLGVSPLAIYVGTATRADALLLGGWLALIYRGEAWGAMLRGARWGTLAAGALVAGSIALLPEETAGLGARLWVDGVRYTVLAVGSMCLIAWSLMPGSVCGRVFSWGWLRTFGRYSYGLYLLHMIALPAILRVGRGVLMGVTHSKAAAVAGAGLGAIVVSLLAAYVSFHLYEKPFLRLKGYFDYQPKQMKLVPGRVGNEVEVSDLVESKSFTSRVLSR